MNQPVAFIGRPGRRISFWKPTATPADRSSPAASEAWCRRLDSKTVAKLRAARNRRRKEVGKVEGRKAYAEKEPELVRRASELSEQRPRLSLRQISVELASQGFTTSRGKAYSASAVASMLDRPAGGAAKGAESKRGRRRKRVT
jgi:hypothetical protein